MREQLYPSGYLLLRDGTRYRIDDGMVMWGRDRNGNKMNFEYSGTWLTKVTDSLGRVVTIAYGTGSFPYCDTITYQGFGIGNPRVIRVWHDKLYTDAIHSALRVPYTLKTVHDLFPLNGASSSPFNPVVVTSVELPNSKSYGFKYNSYGELARVELPTGGAFEYDHDGGFTVNSPGLYMPGPISHGYEIYRRVIERRVYADGGTTPQSKMTISKPEAGGVNVGYALVENRDAPGTLLTSEKHYYYGSAKVPFNMQPTDAAPWDQGKEWKTEAYDVISGSAVLRRAIEHTWQTATGNCAFPQITQTVSTLSDTSQVSKQTFAFDGFCNRTDTWEYDFNSASPLRRTHIDYLTAATYTDAWTGAHLRSLATQQSVFDAGGIEKARTVYEYDNYATDANHASLKNWPAIYGIAISGMDAAFSSSYTYRGNATATTQYFFNTIGTPTGSITAYAQYDLAGNMVKTIDARGYATTIDFKDCFGAPDNEAQANAGGPELNTAGQYGYAFPTRVTNALGQQAYTQFDYYTGRAVNAEDANGVVSAGYSDNEALDRPTRIIRAANQVNGKSQTLFSYDDTNHVITTTSDQTVFGDGLLKSQMIYDGLGRTTETRTYEDAANYIAVKRQYDALGRAYMDSNPFRQNGTQLWTTTTFDGLGRVVSVKSPDNLVVGTSYSGNVVTVTDQTNRKRKSVTDGLGRLKEVYEDPTGVNYLTSYEYNVLDNLKTVTQGAQTRTFTYDSLGRLSSATNPESGTVGYLYDNNGNLTRKTDARGVYIDYVYDPLNRNTTVDYSDTTTVNPDVSRFYDGAVKGVGRFWYSYAGGNYASGGEVDHRAIDSYDALGQPLTQRQLFKAGGVWGLTYSVGQAYDLAGHVKTLTYPSGHVVNYKYDAAGRLNDNGGAALTGNLGDGVSRTYAAALRYDAAGRMQEEKFGTSIPLYHKLHYNIRGQLYDIRLSTTAWQTDEWEWNRGAVLNYYDTSFTARNPNAGPGNNGNVLRSEVYIPNDDQISGYTFMRQNYGYDALNRLTSVTELQNGSSTSFMQAYDYDRWGNRKINSGSWGSGINVMQTAVDANSNRMYAPSDPTHTLMDYDAAGNQTKDYLTWNGTRTYDAENRMITANNGVTDKYTYDADGKRTRRKVGKLETWYVYGIGGELVAEYAPNAPATTPDKEYGYRNGELLVTAAPVNVVLGKTATQSSTFVSGSTTFSAALAIDGNTNGAFWDVSSATTNYGYQNWWQVDLGSSQSLRSIQVWPRTDCCPEQTANFYVLISDNAFTSTDLTTTLNHSGVSSYWVSGNNATVTTINVNRTGRYVRVQRNDSQYLVLAEVKVWQTTTDIEWLVTDHLGTPRMIADAGGSLAGIKRHDYLPFGEELFAGTGGRTPTQGYINDGIRQKFTLKERDLETGLDYLIHRYYCSNQGRFTSADRLFADQYGDDPQSWNLYSYVGNNPLRFTDPFGLWKWVDPDNNGKRFLQWEEGDDWHTLAKFLNSQGNLTYLSGDLEKQFGGGGLGADTIVDVTGAVTHHSSTGGTIDTSWDFYLTVLPAVRGLKLAGGLLKGAWRGVAALLIKREGANLARATVPQIAEELGYFPSAAVKQALKGGVPLDSIPQAEREIAAKFYERVANEAVSGAKEAAAKALNLARAKFLREGGKPPVDIHNF
jgi:RHS repeat-associated protein